MTNAPERIFVQDADPSECDYIGGGWWDDECGNAQYNHVVEYIRADIHAELIRAADELAEAADEDLRAWPATLVEGSALGIALTAYRKVKEKMNAL